MMVRLLIALAAIALARCSLLLDVDGVRARRDSGTSGSDAASNRDAGERFDAPAGDAFEADAAADQDAAAADGSPADVGLSACGRPEAGVLSCAAPITLDNGDLRLPSIAALSDRFVVAYAAAPGIERRIVARDGTIQERETIALGFPPTDLAVAAAGEHWALAFSDGAFRLGCRSSSTSTASTLTPTYEADAVAIAVSPVGSVAIAGARPNSISSSMHTAVAAGGCPAQADLSERSPWFYTRGISAAHLTGGGPLDFRFGLTSIEPIGMDSAVLMIQPDAMFRSRPYNGTGLGPLASTISSDGRFWLTAFAYHESTGLWSLNLTALRTDLGMVSPADREVAPSITDFDFESCGEGCVVAAYLADVDRGRLSLAFYSDDASLTARGAWTYDLACGRPAAAAEVDLAVSASTIGVLYTDGRQLDLYLCDRPPP